LHDKSPPAWKIGSILLVGILAVSTAAPLIRLAIAAADQRGLGFSLVLAGARLALASLFLLPTWGQVRQQALPITGVKFAIAAGVALACHFAAWITSLSYTSITASTALVTTNPIWIALLAWLWHGERPKAQTLIGMAIALSGGLILGLGQSTTSATSSQPLLGNSLALFGAWMVSGYLLLGREAQRQGVGLGAYTTIAYTVAAIVLVPLPWLVGASYQGLPLSVYGYITLTALLPQLIGHTSFNWAVRWVSPTLVTLLILFEPALASLMGYLLFGEIPGPTVGLGASILLLGVAIAALA